MEMFRYPEGAGDAKAPPYTASSDNMTSPAVELVLFVCRPHVQFEEWPGVPLSSPKPVRLT